MGNGSSGLLHGSLGLGGHTAYGMFTAHIYYFSVSLSQASDVKQASIVMAGAYTP